MSNMTCGRSPQSIRQRRPRVGTRLALLAGTIALAGCGNTYELVSVSGRVTLNGQPVPAASVIFQPASSSDGMNAGPASYGRTDADGRYELKSVLDDRQGAVVGTHMILIALATPSGSQDDAADVVLNETVAARFRDGSLRYEVTNEGTERSDFELSDSGDR